jgi:hypothetical protein
MKFRNASPVFSDQLITLIILQGRHREASYLFNKMRTVLVKSSG